MTQREVADLIGRNQQNIAHWEAGVAQPDAATLYTLARLYGVTVDRLINDEVTLDETPKDNGKVLSLSAAANTQAAQRVNALSRVFLTLDEHGRKLVEQIAENEQRRCLAQPPAESDAVLLRVYDTPASAGTGSYLDGDGCSLRELNDVPDGTDFGVFIQGDSMEPRLHDGDIAFVKAAEVLDSGDIGLFVLNNEAFCKRLRVDDGHKRVYLDSLNPNYLPICVSAEDALRTVGKILGGVSFETGC